MPELPDITAYITALKPHVLGKRLEQVQINGPFLLRTVEPKVAEAEGQLVGEVRRVGKRIALGMENGVWLVLHLMIAGRLHWKALPVKLGSKNVLAGFLFADGALTLTEAGSKRRASLYVVRGEDGIRALDPGGIDVFAATPAEFRAALTKENRTLKRALTDPRIVDGIGNSYSDEILHAAKMSPILQTGKLTDEEWARLYEATRSTLRLWMDRMNAEAKKSFPEKVTAFRPEMAVHGKFEQPCPVCGTPVQRIRYADNETNYCPVCQTGGKVLADRSLSRLLKSDWPRTLDELEALKRK
jgi:formamidopyrimidine-DNA glycosylase